jgi:hypothetical protein
LKKLQNKKSEADKQKIIDSNTKGEEINTAKINKSKRNRKG